MDMVLSNELKQFQAKIQHFLSLNLTPELQRAHDLTTSIYTDYHTAITWQNILYQRGWAAPLWPKAYGGCGWPMDKRLIFAHELAKAHAPMLSPMGLLMLGPALLAYGSEWQKNYFLPRILSGNDYWCQGFSEPQAGSDLANLNTKAIRYKDHYRVTGTKIWTTHAQYANKMFCLVKTQNDDIPQRSISFLLINMDAKGVSIKPIKNLSGESTQNQVFLDDVIVPTKNLVGEENQGWEISKYLFRFERAGIIWAPILSASLNQLKHLAQQISAHSSALHNKLAALSIQLNTYQAMEQGYINAMLMQTENPNEAPMLKLLCTELKQRISELTMNYLGEFAIPWYVPKLHDNSFLAAHLGPFKSALPRYLNARAASIYAGSNEIQYNILAKQMLNL